MSIIDKLVDQAGNLTGGLIGQAVDAAPDLLGAGSSTPAKPRQVNNADMGDEPLKVKRRRWENGIEVVDVIGAVVVNSPGVGPENKIAALFNGKDIQLNPASVNKLTNDIKDLQKSGYTPTSGDRETMETLLGMIRENGNTSTVSASDELARTMNMELGVKSHDQQAKHGDPFKDGTEPGNIKPSSHQLADGTIVLEPGNTPDALTAEAALNSGQSMPGEKPLSDKWWKKVQPEGSPSNLMSQSDSMDQSGRFSFTNFGEFLQALFKKFFPTNEEGARMASNAPFKNLKLENGEPVVVPKDIESIDPKTGKTPELEPAVNPLAPNPMQPMAMDMNNPTPGMKFA